MYSTYKFWSYIASTFWTPNEVVFIPALQNMVLILYLTPIESRLSVFFLNGTCFNPFKLKVANKNVGPASRKLPGSYTRSHIAASILTASIGGRKKKKTQRA